ncbi:hypothetical protein [Nocardia sp. CDC160]|uniref:hypothetical protein n=1 Tax=Nocardia sp. CDC160 TaxID=3112166 RepID=UPI002DBB10D9|nr:hypothetical protein [Nocardia sp. CDC160]MEC3920292.1 hypothetical protein [Nocardia sp. CDC160]
MHAFVDETKQHGLLIVSTLTEVCHLQQARKVLQSKRLPGQNRIHFKTERDSRRHEICSALCALKVRVMVYDATAIKDAVEARTDCLTAVVEDLAALGGRRLTIEQDDSLVQADRRTFYNAVRKFDVAATLEYEHRRPNQEPLLWVSDAVAWCVAKGGDWRRRVDPLITQVRKLS